MPSLAAKQDSGQSLRFWLAGSRTDRLLLATVVATIMVGWQWLYRTIEAGPPMVMIYHGDEVLARYPIPTGDKVIRFQAEGELGESEIVIDKNGARFASSPCTIQYCVRSGHRHQSGDVVACVPNRILIALEGTPEKEDMDALAE